VTDAELFPLLDLDTLPEVQTAFAATDIPAAKAALATHIRQRRSPQWLFDHRDRPTPTKKAEDFPKALARERREFTFGFHGAPDFTTQFGESIDWAANPTKGEFKTHLWNECLNRHFHFDELSQAYWETGDERFVRALTRDWIDWVEHNPRPEDSGNSVQWPYGSYAWQTLTTAIRLEASWPNAMYRCLDSSEFTDDLIVAMMGSVCDQAGHLVQWPTRNNWLTEECMGLYTAGVLFPEFKEAAQWRRIAIARLYGQLTDEVYPDGAEIELAAGYGFWVLRNFISLMERARVNGLGHELPDDLVERLEKMFEYPLSVSTPDGRAPGLNDSSNADVTGLLCTGHELFPQREDFLFVASRGEEGTRPEQISTGLPWSGHYAMRTGWDADALYMLVDSGPYGSAHQHEDKLHFVLHAYGRQLILDPGNYSYDASRQRQYVLTTPGHNTVMVDGIGQHRRGNEATYCWPRPWEGEAPPDNDTLWVSTDEFDVLRGTYRDGYGRPLSPKTHGTRRPESDEYDVLHTATHTRRIIFLKPDYWVIADTMVPADGGEHSYDSLFHLDAEEASVDGDSGAVRTHTDGPNVAIRPLADAGLDVEIVKGREEPCQGWGNDPWRPVPTAIFSFSGKGTRWATYVVEPLARGESPGVSAMVRIESSAGPEALGIEVRHESGARDVILLKHQPSSETAGTATFGEWELDGEIGVVRLSAELGVESVCLAGADRLSRDGEAVG
jgi:hypothetical protein